MLIQKECVQSRFKANATNSSLYYLHISSLIGFCSFYSRNVDFLEFLPPPLLLRDLNIDGVLTNNDWIG
jgi:hypothetical protein